MIEEVTIQQAVATHQRDLTHLLEDCTKEIEAAYKTYTIAHKDDLRTYEISKRVAAHGKENKTYGRTFEMRQKDYEEAMSNALTLFRDSETRIEAEFSTATGAVLKRYSGSLAQAGEAFGKAILPA